jgi:multidrug efflux system membrane fusion protein
VAFSPSADGKASKSDMAARSRFRIGFIVLGVLAVGLALWTVLGPKKKAQANRNPMVPVSVAKAAYADVPISISALGSVQAWQSNLIRAQVNGKLLKVDVQEGSFVKQGQVLAEIDSAPYAAALSQAEGALKRDSALLKNAMLDLERYRKLAATDSISQQQVDTQTALVQQDEGIVQIDTAVVANARINFNYCRIVAPVSGRVGVRLVDAGNLVSTNDTNGILVVNQLSPIAVTFTVPEGDFQRLAALSNGFSAHLKTEAFSQETGVLLDTGELTVADNRVDPATGTVQLKARFENREMKLWPGQFVNVRLVVQTLSQALTIPAAAVNQGPNGTFTYIVSADRKVAVRPITVSATQDATAVVQKGVEPGETVVTDGQVSLTQGSSVIVRGAGGPPGGGAPGAGGGQRRRKPS